MILGLGSVGVYAGNPAKVIADLVLHCTRTKREKLEEILTEYASVSRYHGIAQIVYTAIHLSTLRISKSMLKRSSIVGTEDEETDDFRDFMRKWGIRIYTERPFKSKSKAMENKLHLSLQSQ